MEAKGRPREATGRPKGGQWNPKGSQKDAKGRPKEAKGRPKGDPGRPKEAKTEKEVSPSPFLHHFGTQSPTKFALKFLKNGFENNAEYKYVFPLVLGSKTLPKPLPKPPKNHQTSNEKKKA